METIDFVGWLLAAFGTGIVVLGMPALLVAYARRAVSDDYE